MMQPLRSPVPRPPWPGPLCPPHLPAHGQASSLLVLFPLIAPRTGPGLAQAGEGCPHSHVIWGAVVPKECRGGSPQTPANPVMTPHHPAPEQGLRLHLCAPAQPWGAAPPFPNKPLPEGLPANPAGLSETLSRSPWGSLPDTSLSWLNTEAWVLSWGGDCPPVFSPKRIRNSPGDQKPSRAFGEQEGAQCQARPRGHS